MGCTEHQLFLLSVEMREGWGAPCAHMEGDLMAALALPVIPQVLPWSGMHLCTWCTPQYM